MRSDDDRKRALALTEAAKTKSMPDPQLLRLVEIESELKAMVRRYPADEVSSAALLSLKRRAAMR